MHPIETLCYTYRGIKGLSMDLHRIPEKVEETSNILLERTDILPAVISKAENGTSSEHVFDAMMAFLGHTVLKTSMFEKIYWPYVQKVIDYVVKYDKTLLLFFEGNNSRFWHLFQDIPKGHVCVQIEQEDIFEAKKKIGDQICIAGGFPLDLLAGGTKQQCLDYAKKLVDELAPGGGYMFRTDRGITFKRDAKQENLMAINEFVKNYKLVVNYI